VSEEVKEKIVELMRRPLVAFAIEAGTSVIVLAICWGVVTIIRMLLGA